MKLQTKRTTIESNYEITDFILDAGIAVIFTSAALFFLFVMGA